MQNKLSVDDIIHYLRKAYEYARNSPDLSSQVGALILNKDMDLIGTGFNTFTNNTKELPERLQRPQKYYYIEHAERNAIFNAAFRNKYELRNATMVAPWSSCCDCARTIIASGITTLVRHKEILDQSPEHWKENITVAEQMMQEAGIEIIDYSGKLWAGQVRVNGQLWEP